MENSATIDLIIQLLTNIGNKLHSPSHSIKKEDASITKFEYFRIIKLLHELIRPIFLLKNGELTPNVYNHIEKSIKDLKLCCGGIKLINPIQKKPSNQEIVINAEDVGQLLELVKKKQK